MEPPRKPWIPPPLHHHDYSCKKPAKASKFVTNSGTDVNKKCAVNLIIYGRFRFYVLGVRSNGTIELEDTVKLPSKKGAVRVGNTKVRWLVSSAVRLGRTGF